MKIHFGIKFIVEKGTFDVHLVKFKAFVSSISEKDLDGFKTSNRSKGLVVVESFDLSKSFGYQFRFVSDYDSDIVEFVSEDPSCTNNRGILRRRDKSPHLISVKFC